MIDALWVESPRSLRFRRRRKELRITVGDFSYRSRELFVQLERSGQKQNTCIFGTTSQPYYVDVTAHAYRTRQEVRRRSGANYSPTRPRNRVAWIESRRRRKKQGVKGFAAKDDM